MFLPTWQLMSCVIQFYGFHWSTGYNLPVLIGQQVFIWRYTGVRRFCGGDDGLLLSYMNLHINTHWHFLNSYVFERSYVIFSFKCHFNTILISYSFYFFWQPLYIGDSQKYYLYFNAGRFVKLFCLCKFEGVFVKRSFVLLTVKTSGYWDCFKEF